MNEDKNNKSRWFLTLVLIPLLTAIIGGFAVIFAATNSDFLKFERGNIVQKYIGYYADWDKNKNLIYCKEYLTLTFHGSSAMEPKEVDGIISGSAQLITGDPIDRQWKFQGYRTDDYLAWTYASTGIEDSGIGSVFLTQRGNVYQGFWIGRDINYNVIIGGAYILSKENMDSQKMAELYPMIKKRPFNLGEIPYPVYATVDSILHLPDLNSPIVDSIMQGD